MKLEVAAVNVVVEDSEIRNGASSRAQRVLFGALGGALAGMVFLIAGLLLAGSATALDGIDLSDGPTQVTPGECPPLVKIKYPFLTCPSGQIGMTDANATWDNSRQMPLQSEFIEGDGAWGPSLNQN